MCVSYVSNCGGTFVYVYVYVLALPLKPNELVRGYARLITNQTSTIANVNNKKYGFINCFKSSDEIPTTIMKTTTEKNNVIRVSFRTISYTVETLTAHQNHPDLRNMSLTY